MNFSEFKRRLGAEPRSTEPDFVAARDASPEHRRAATEADIFEKRLERALDVDVPEGLEGRLLRLPDRAHSRRLWPAALAATVMLAVGAAAVGWNLSRGWESVDEYVMDHFRHDGETVIALAAEAPSGDIQAILGEFGVQAMPGLADRVRLVKFCPAPGGKGVHMILDTGQGPVTVFYLPETTVEDRRTISFDGHEAILVSLERGAAVIVPESGETADGLHALVHDALVPVRT